MENLQKTGESRIEERSQKGQACPPYPLIIGEILDALQVLAPDLQRNTLHGMVLSCLSYAVCSMRVQFRETANSRLNFPNLYTAFYLHSNKGKDSTTRLIKDTVLAPLKEFQKEQEQRYKVYRYHEIEAQVKDKHPSWTDKKRDLKVEELLAKERRFTIGANSSGTPEGLYAEVEGYKKRKTGAVFVEQSEAGAFAESKSERKQEFLTCLYVGYDNRQEGRNLKEISYSTIEGVPIVAEFLSAPDIMKANKSFIMRQKTAFARRIWTFMETEWKKTTSLPSLREVEEAKEKLKGIGDVLFGETFQKIMNLNTFPDMKEYIFQKSLDTKPTFKPVDIESVRNAIFKLEEGLYDTLYLPYKCKTIELYNSMEEDEIARQSVSEYPFRALKVATIYAILNHPQDFTIKAEDFMQATQTVEQLDGMQTFTNYQPADNDAIGYICDYLVKQVPAVYAKSQLYNAFMEAMKGKIKGTKRLTREFLSVANFSRTKADIKEELQRRGYDLKEDKGNTTAEMITIVKQSVPTVDTVAEATQDAEALIYG